MTHIRVGYGYDAHRLGPDRKLILCGVEIPYDKGLLGHSDADVALHALIDAMLGAAGAGDIGEHFSDKDTRYKDISSITLLKKTMDIINQKGLHPVNVDITITAQSPKLTPYKAEMKENIAKVLNIDIDLVNVKAKTTEGLGFEGESLGISAHAVVLLQAK